MYDLHPEQTIATAIGHMRARAAKYGQELAAASDTHVLAEICGEWLARQPIEPGYTPQKTPDPPSEHRAGRDPSDTGRMYHDGQLPKRD